MGKKWIGIVTILLFVLWGSKVVSINKQYKESSVYYNMKQVIDSGDITIEPLEAHLYTKKEFENAFMRYIEKDCELNIAENSKVLCLKVRMKNQSLDNISWDVVMDSFGYGFESATWASSSNPLLGQNLNIFYSETFESRSSQEIWFMADVSPECFSKKTWSNIDDVEFDYVLSLQPKSERIKLTYSNGGKE